VILTAEYIEDYGIPKGWGIGHQEFMLMVYTLYPTPLHLFIRAAITFWNYCSRSMEWISTPNSYGIFVPESEVEVHLTEQDRIRRIIEFIIMIEEEKR